MNLTTIEQVIAEVETKNNIEAIRFEPTVYARMVNVSGDIIAAQAIKSILGRIVAVHDCSWHTALMIYSASFGRTQLMGFNLYGQLDYARSVTHYLSNDADQAACFSQFLTHAGLGDTTPIMLAEDQHCRLKFAIAYNGSIAYVTPLVAALRKFGFEVD